MKRHTDINRDPLGLDCIYLSEGGGISGKQGDCTSSTDSGYYVNCDGCLVDNSGNIFANPSVNVTTGDLTFTDADGNVISTIQGFTDPTEDATQVQVNGGSAPTVDLESIGSGNAANNCGTTSLPRSFGVSYGGNADAGAGYEGISAAGSAGAGVFYNGNTGASTGAFAGGGATAYFFNGNIGAPEQQGQPFNLGGYAGVGPSVWISNAGGAPQLGGPFTTLSLNVGAGLVKGSLQLSYGGGIWQLSIGPPIPYVSAGTPSISVSKITTKTVTTSGCH